MVGVGVVVVVVVGVAVVVGVGVGVGVAVVVGVVMNYLRPNASPYQVERFMSECRASALEAYLDDHEPREDPGRRFSDSHAVEFMDWED